MGYNEKLACYGREMSLQEWAAETGFSYGTLYARKRKGLPPEMVLSPLGPKGKPRKKRSETVLAVFRAQEKLGEMCSSPWECLAAAIVCRAILDYYDPQHRSEVERLFRGEWFSLLSDLDGERVIGLMQKAAS